MGVVVSGPIPRSDRVATKLLLLCCLLPLLPSLLLLKWVSLEVSGVNLRAMDDALALKRSVPISIPMLGALLGNLGDVIQLPLHKDTPPDGSLAGLYFQPALWIGFVIGLMKRQWLWVSSCLLILALLGLQSFPFLTALFVGPLEGFRWTFKILIFTGPLFMLWLLPHLEETFTPRRVSHHAEPRGCGLLDGVLARQAY